MLSDIRLSRLLSPLDVWRKRCSDSVAGAVLECSSVGLDGEEGEEGEEEDESRVTPEEKQRWLALRKSAKAFLHTEPKYAYVPLLEEQPLGST